MVALALAAVLAAAEVDSAYDDRTRVGVTLLGAAIGVAAPMLAGLASNPACPNGRACDIGLVAGGALGTVVSAPLLALLANRIAGGRASLGWSLLSGVLTVVPSSPLTVVGSVLAMNGLAPQWATNTLLAAGALVACIMVTLIIERSHRFTF